MINRRTLSKTPRHYCSGELFFFPSEGRKALASSSTRILKNALHKSIIVQSLLPVGMDVSMIWRSESKTSLSGFENCGQRSRMEELSRYFMVATADVYGHVWGLLWAHPEISGEGWPAGLADAGGGLWPQWPPVDASQYSRPQVGPSAWFHRAQCWPVLALSPDLIEHSGLDCVPVLSLSLKKPGSFYFSSPGSTGIYLFGCVGDTCSTWDLVSRAGFKPGPPALGVRSLSHWTIRGNPCSGNLGSPGEKPVHPVGATAQRGHHKALRTEAAEVWAQAGGSGHPGALTPSSGDSERRTKVPHGPSSPVGTTGMAGDLWPAKTPDPLNCEKQSNGHCLKTSCFGTVCYISTENQDWTRRGTLSPRYLRDFLYRPTSLTTFRLHSKRAKPTRQLKPYAGLEENTHIRIFKNM